MRVSHSIEMVRLGWMIQRIKDPSPLIFSPDGHSFVVVAEQGSLATGMMDSSLMMFSAKRGSFVEALRHTLVSFSTGSNDPPISDVEWLDEHTLIFLGTDGNHARQVYKVDVKTRRTTKLTDHPHGVVMFKAGARGFLFAARPGEESLWAGRDPQMGFVVGGERLSELTARSTGAKDDLGFRKPLQIYARRSDASEQRLTEAEGCRLLAVFSSMSALSPDGRYFIAPCYATGDDVRAKRWRLYAEASSPDVLLRGYVVVDLEKARARLLIDAPMGLTGGVPSEGYWLSENTFRMSGVYLPLGDESQISPQLLEQKYVVDFDVNAQGAFTVVRNIQMDATAKSPSHAASVSPPKVWVEQSIDQWPRIVTDVKGVKRVLWDPNPSFAKLALGDVEEIHWRDEIGSEYTGGLFLPPDFVPTRKYPLVIQTHGWKSDRFELDGLGASAGYAARALASAGFMVAQVPDTYLKRATLEEEAELGMKCFEGLISALQRRGNLDVERIGIQGWSRTGYAVRHALTFSKVRFGAAVILDAMEGSISQYLADLNQPDMAALIEEFHGGSGPFGEGLSSWQARSTFFNLHRVRTPVRLLAFGGNSSLIQEWGWYTGLRHFKTPVELVWMPEAEHAPVRPKERLVSQQETVEWFQFWLQGRESKADGSEQRMAAWRKLRERWPGRS